MMLRHTIECRPLLVCIACIAFALAPCESIAQSSSAERVPSLVVRESRIERASFPVVDVHTHFFIKGKHDPELLDRYVQMMDRNRIAVSISLDGQLGSQLESHTAFLWRRCEQSLKRGAFAG